MNWIKIGTYTLIIIPTLFVGVVLGFYLIQDYMIFLGEKLPLDHRFSFQHEFEELNFKTSDGHSLNALLFRAKDSKGLVIYHHGNAGNLQGWAGYAAIFTKNNFDVLFYDYRGYGKSSGKIKKESQLIGDAQLVTEKIKEQYADKRILHYGISLGSGVAAKLASLEQPDGLILETPYYNFYELVHYHYPYLPAKIMSKYKLRTDKCIGEIDCPILILHGNEDKVVPYEQGKRLSELKDNIQFAGIESGVHNNLSDFKAYHLALSAFLNQF